MLKPPFIPQQENEQNNIIMVENPSIKFIANSKNQNFQMKLSKLDKDNIIEKIEFNFENDIILIKSGDKLQSYIINFPDSLKMRKSLLSPNHFHWETTKTQIVISYKHPPEVITIDDALELENFSKPQKKFKGMAPTIFIDDVEERCIKKIDPKIIEQNQIYVDEHSLKNKMRMVMESINKEFCPSYKLKPKEIKTLSQLLLAKGYESYGRAQQDGYGFDVVNLKLEKVSPNDDFLIENPKEIEMMEENNAFLEAIEELKEAEKHPKHESKNKRIISRNLEKHAMKFLEQHQSKLDEEEKEILEHEIKKKGSLYIINENKFKAMFRKKNEQIKQKEIKPDIPPLDVVPSKTGGKRNRNLFIEEGDDEGEFCL